MGMRKNKNTGKEQQERKKKRAEETIPDPRGQARIVGQGGVPGLARQSRPVNLPGRQKHVVTVWRKRWDRA